MSLRVKVEQIGIANTWSWESHMWWATQNLSPERMAEMWAKYGAIRTAQWESAQAA